MSPSSSEYSIGIPKAKSKHTQNGSIDDPLGLRTGVSHLDIWSDRIVVPSPLALPWMISFLWARRRRSIGPCFGINRGAWMNIQGMEGTFFQPQKSTRTLFFHFSVELTFFFKFEVVAFCQIFNLHFGHKSGSLFFCFFFTCLMILSSYCLYLSWNRVFHEKLFFPLLS